MIVKFAGGPVGLGTLSTAVGEDTATLEEVYEPYLIQHGLLQRTPRGRVATERAYAHLGYAYTPPAQLGIFAPEEDDADVEEDEADPESSLVALKVPLTSMLSICLLLHSAGFLLTKQP